MEAKPLRSGTAQLLCAARIKLESGVQPGKRVADVSGSHCGKEQGPVLARCRPSQP
jgi:hypothetical protein